MIDKIEPANAFMMVDVVSKILAAADDIHKLSEWLSIEIREMTGARLILMVAKKTESGNYELLKVNPERKKDLCDSLEMSYLIRKSFLFEQITELTTIGEDDIINNYLYLLGFETNLAIPLIANKEAFGSILVLGLPTKNNLELLKTTYHNLTILLGLVFRNASLIDHQEKIIQERTSELIEQNLALESAKEELEENEIRLKAQNEEYESLNEELVQTNEELMLAKDEAEKSDRLKTAFLQNMSHEIRTPMNAIVGFSNMLEKPDLPSEKRKNFTSIIVNSSKQLLSIVTDILTISSLETQQETKKISKVCINSMLIDVLTIFKPQAAKQNISLYTKQELTGTESVIYTDSSKLNQILSNLVNNALKFTHQGEIEFGYQKKDNFLEFFVKDTGIGIPKDMQVKIFDRFRQVEITANRMYGGTGLGLSISKGFVELLGGKIWVESELEKGSAFYFTVPYHSIYSFDEVHFSAKKNQTITTILVAEDEEYNYLFLEELLMGLNFKLIHCKNGLETVEICKSNPNINLIFMDIKMPIMDGHTAAKFIKEFRPDLPIIAQSAYALEHEKESFGGIAFNDYITKPINEIELKEKLTKYLISDMGF